jgi:hypothetical protein
MLPADRLTPQLPSHLQGTCLAQVATTGNWGTQAGTVTEVWGGPLSAGAYVMGLWNRGGAAATTVTARWRFLGVPGIDDTTTLCVRDLWAGANLGPHIGSVAMTVDVHDLALVRLSLPPCAT